MAQMDQTPPPSACSSGGASGRKRLETASQLAPEAARRSRKPHSEATSCHSA